MRRFDVVRKYYSEALRNIISDQKPFTNIALLFVYTGIIIVVVPYLFFRWLLVNQRPTILNG